MNMIISNTKILSSQRRRIIIQLLLLQRRQQQQQQQQQQRSKSSLLLLQQHRQLLPASVTHLPINPILVLQHVLRFYSTNTTHYHNGNNDNNNCTENISLPNHSTTIENSASLLSSSSSSSSWYDENNDFNNYYNNYLYNTNNSNNNSSYNNTNSNNLSTIGITLDSIIHTKIPFVHTYTVDEIQLVIYQIDSILLNNNNNNKNSSPITTNTNSTSTTGSSTTTTDATTDATATRSVDNIDYNINNNNSNILLTNYHVTNLIEPLANALLQTIIHDKTYNLNNIITLDYRINTTNKTAVILIEHLLNICLYNIPTSYNNNTKLSNDTNNNTNKNIIDMIYYRMIVPYPTIQLYNIVLSAICNFYGMANTVDEIFNLMYYEYEREYTFLQNIVIPLVDASSTTGNAFSKQLYERYDNTIKNNNNTIYKKNELLYCRSALPNKDTYRYVIRSWSNIKPIPSSTVRNNNNNNNNNNSNNKKNNKNLFTKSNEVVELRNSHAVPRTARMYLSHLEDICLSALDTNNTNESNDTNSSSMPFRNSSTSSSSNNIQDTMMKRTHSLQSTTTSRMIDSIPKQNPINPIWKVLHTHYADTHISRQQYYGGRNNITDIDIDTKATDAIIQQQQQEQEQYFLSLLPDRQMYQTLLVRIAYGATTVANRYRDVQTCISESVQIIQSMTKIRHNLLLNSGNSTTTTTTEQQQTSSMSMSMSSSSYYQQIANLYILNNVSYFSILSCYQKYIELFPLIWETNDNMNRPYQRNDTNNKQSWNTSTSTYNNTSSYNNSSSSKERTDYNKGSLDISILSRMITILEKMLEQQQDYNNNSNNSNNNNNDYIIHDNYETILGLHNQVPHVTISSAYGVIIKALLRTESESNSSNLQDATDILLLLTDKNYSTEYRRTRNTTTSTNNYKTSSDLIIDILLKLTSKTNENNRSRSYFQQNRQAKLQQQQQPSFELGWPSSDIILEVLQGWEYSSPIYERKRVDRIKQSALFNPNAPWFNTRTVRQSENDDDNNNNNAKKQSLLETVLYFWSKQSNLTNSADICHSILQIAIEKQRPVFVRYLQNRPYAIGKNISTKNNVTLSPLAFEIVLLYWLHSKRDDSPQKIELLVRKLIELHTLEVIAYCTERKYNFKKFAISKQKGEDVFQFTPTEVHIRYLLISWINFCRNGKKYYTIDKKELLYPAQHCENIVNSIENEYWFKDNYVGNYAFALRGWAEQELGNNSSDSVSHNNNENDDGLVINPVHHARKLLNQYKAHVQQYYKNVPSFKLPPYASNWVLMVCKRQQVSHNDKLDAYQLAVDTFQETYINSRSFVLMVEVIKEQLLPPVSLTADRTNNKGVTDSTSMNNDTNTQSLPVPVINPEITKTNEIYMNYIILLFQQACVDGLVSHELIVHVLQIATPDILIDMFRGSTYTDCDLAIFIAKKAGTTGTISASSSSLSSVQVSNFVVDTDSLPPSFRLKNLPPQWTSNVIKSRR